MGDAFWRSLLNPVVPDAVTEALDARMNAQRMLMSLRSGKVQRLELWQEQRPAGATGASDLVEVKRLDGRWVRVS